MITRRRYLTYERQLHTKQGTFSNLRKRVWGVLFPEEVFALQVIPLTCGFTIHNGFDSDAIELDSQNIRDERLVLQSIFLSRPGLYCPRMRDHGYEIEITIENDYDL